MSIYVVSAHVDYQCLRAAVCMPNPRGTWCDLVCLRITRHLRFQKTVSDSVAWGLTKFQHLLATVSFSILDTLCLQQVDQILVCGIPWGKGVHPALNHSNKIKRDIKLYHPNTYMM